MLMLGQVPYNFAKGKADFEIVLIVDHQRIPGRWTSRADRKKISWQVSRQDI